jgi:hypothetical protein
MGHMDDPKNAPGDADAQPQDPQSQDGAPTPSDAPDDVKSKFREALERKRAEHLDNAADTALREGSKIHGEHGKAGGGRTFRRKAGG